MCLFTYCYGVYMLLNDVIAFGFDRFPVDKVFFFIAIHETLKPIHSVYELGCNSVVYFDNLFFLYVVLHDCIL